MSQSSSAAGRGNTQAAIRHATEAEESLNEAARLLSRQIQKVNSDVATEQLAQLEAAVQSLHNRQQQLAAKTREIDQATDAPTGHINAQVDALRRLARDQQSLQQETSDLATRLESVRVFQRVLTGSARQMAIAAGWLARQTADPRPQEAQQAALDSLAQLIRSLRSTSATAQQVSPGRTQGAPATGGLHPRAVAELRLLKLLQQDLFARTQNWEKQFGQVSPLPPEAQQQYKQLSDEQGQLADLLFELLGDEAAGNRAAEPASPDQL